MILKLQGAERVGDVFQHIGETVGVIVHRVDFPGVAGAMVVGFEDPVDNRIPHVEIWRSHIDLGAQHMAALGKLAILHPFEQIEVLLDTAVAVGALLAGFGQGAAILPYFFRRQLADIGLVLFDQCHGKFIELREIVRGIQSFFSPLKTQPADIFL